MAAAIAQAQEMGKAARIKAFDIATPANVQGQHFGVIGAKRLDKSSPTPPVTLRSTLYPHIPPVYLRPTSLSSHLTTLPALPGAIPRNNFRPISLFPCIPIFLPPILLRPYPPAPK